MELTKKEIAYHLSYLPASSYHDKDGFRIPASVVVQWLKQTHTEFDQKDFTSHWLVFNDELKYFTKLYRLFYY